MEIVGHELLPANLEVGMVKKDYNLKIMKVLYIITVPMRLLEHLVFKVLFLKTEKTLEKINDLKVTPTFKVVYPPNYDSTKRDFNSWIDNIYGK